MSHPHRLQTAPDCRAFALAGNATLTLKSKRTGTRFTYRIRQPGPDKPHFVGLLAGPDNEASYSFLGSIFSSGEYRHGARSKIVYDAPSARAFHWFWRAIAHDTLPDTLEVWHEGRCGRCGRKLTVPESIAKGLGPECASKGENNEEE